MLVELTDAEAANDAAMKNIASAFDFKASAVVRLDGSIAVAGTGVPAANNDRVELPPIAVAPAAVVAPLPPIAHAAPVMPTIPGAGMAAFGHIAEVAYSLPSAPLPKAPLIGPGGVAIDHAGYPWDHRIHADGKAMLKDGTWRQKRNTSKEMRTAVEAELRASGFPELNALSPAAAPAGPTASDDAPSTNDAIAPQSVETPELTDEQRAQLAAVALAAAAQPSTDPAIAPPLPAILDAANDPQEVCGAAEPTAPAPTFAELMMSVQNAVASGKVPLDWLTAQWKARGLASLTVLMSRPDVVAAIAADLAHASQAAAA